MNAAERKLQAVPPPTEPREVTAPHVFQAIADVMADLSKDGIAKSRHTEGNGPKYNFRGIDDVYNALAPILAERKLVVTPRCLSREVVERKSNSGGALFYVTVQMEFTLASAIDGSSVVACMYGEALDSGDKATNKAMSAAYKYMAMQQFCIPTEGDNDADATTHEVAAKQEKAPPQQASRAPTLAERADRLEVTLKGVKTKDYLHKAYKLASGLCADLDRSDPERLAEINALYEERQVELDAQ